jgi:hypothetical protein
MRIGFPNSMKTRAALPLAGLLLLVVCANLAQAEDWFVKGRVYNNVQVTKVNPDSVSVSYTGGTGRLALADLPADIAKRFVAAAKRAQAFAELEKKAETDPIDHLIVSLDQNGMWMNGMFVDIDSPANASPAELLDALARANRAYGDLKGAKIIESRQIQIDPMTAPFTAVRVTTANGGKIVLFQYMDGGARGGSWWNREFPVDY